MNNKIQLARKLRQNATIQERILWKKLRNPPFTNFKFRRQYPIGCYIMDFVCIEKLLIIEIDGGQHNKDAGIFYDCERTKYLNNRGFKVIRFWNSDVDNNLEGVCIEILKNLN